MNLYSRFNLAAKSFHNAISPKNYWGFISSPNVYTGNNSTAYTPFSFLHSTSKSNSAPYQGTGSNQRSPFGKEFTQFGKPPEESGQKWLSKSSKWLFASAVLASFYYMNFETVPFTKRSRFVFFPSIIEREIGKIQMEHQILQSWVVLPKTHPRSIRAGLIFDEIIKGLKMAVDEDNRKGTLKSTTKHLEKLKWEIFVVHDTSVLVSPLPDGKILINTLFLQSTTTDTELAALIAHEVARVVARHYAEQVTAKMWHRVVVSLSVFPYLFFSYLVPMPEVVNKIGRIIGKLRKLQEKNALEADNIAVLLMAWAGYDPRVAPEAYRMSGDQVRCNGHANYPSGKFREASLVRSGKMEMAVSIYMKKQVSGSSGEGKVSEAN